jgi:hypothetical protein
MSLLLLSEAATTTVTLTSLIGVYIALGGTLVAAGLAAFASFRASNKASGTAREVAELSTRTAQELKDKDYQNDFYKRIIEKRLKAWEEAENLMSLLLNSKVDREDGARLPYYFDDVETFEKILLKMRSLAGQAFWLGGEFSTNLRTFNQVLTRARRECLIIDSDENEIIDSKKLYIAGKAYHSECIDLLTELAKILGRRIRVLHDIPAFFRELDNLGVNKV